MKSTSIPLMAGLLLGSILNSVGQSMSTLDAIVVHADIPQYPAIAITARLQGEVRIHAVVEDGKVIKAESDSSSDLKLLVNAAVENVKTWEFAKGVRGELNPIYKFELRKDEGDAPENPHVEMELPKFVKLTVRPTKPTVNYSSLTGSSH